jgi:hypothetical protein
VTIPIVTIAPQAHEPARTVPQPPAPGSVPPASTSAP